MVKTMRRNTDAPVSGGATGTSGEAPVMGVEQSGGVVRSRTWANSQGRSRVWRSLNGHEVERRITAKAILQPVNGSA